MIVAAAIKSGNVIYQVPAPGRHIDVAIARGKAGINAPGEHGFVDDSGCFLRRKPAALHALRCGQVKEEAINWNLGLYSEDLW